MNHMNWLAVYPELLLLIMSCAVALVDLFVKDERRLPTYLLTLATLVVVGGLHLAYVQGGFTVYGKLRPAAQSLREGGLPLGLAHHVRLRHAVAAGQPVRWDDVEIDPSLPAVRFRRDMERWAQT